MRNYLAPNYLLALFLQHYGASEAKGSFPYELVKSVHDLYKPGIPTRADFFSTLRGETISIEAYDAVKCAWNVNGMCRLFDLLKWYSLLDVHPFLEVVLVYLTHYKIRNLDLFKTAISLPGTSLNWTFDTIAKEHKFQLFAPRHADIGQIM